MHPQFPFCAARLLVGHALISALILELLGAAERLLAQGIEGDSLADENTATAKKNSPTNHPYNLRLGLVTIRADTGIRANVSEEAKRYRAGLSLVYNVMDHANISSGYQYVLKDANPSYLNYS